MGVCARWVLCLPIGGSELRNADAIEPVGQRSLERLAIEELADHDSAEVDRTQEVRKQRSLRRAREGPWSGLRPVRWCTKACGATSYAGARLTLLLHCPL